MLNRWIPSKKHVGARPAPPEPLPVQSTSPGNNSGVPPDRHRANGVNGSASNGNGFIDHAALDKIAALQREGQPSLLHKIINMYFQSSPDLLQKIREAVTSSDAPSLHRAAHTLKSSSANLGAFKLAELCKEMETIGKTNVLLEAETILFTIEKEYEGVRQALAVQIQEG